MFLSLFQKEEDLFGLLNLCLMKELSAKLEDEQIEKLPELLSHIMKLLKKGYSYSPISKELIVELLKRIKGSNILNFSNYLDTIIDNEQKQLLLQYLDKNDLEYIQDIKERLSNYNEYMKLFEKDFEERKRNSIFEFSIISLVVMEREDFQNFEKERKSCPNRVDKILYHGTGIEPISNLLTGYFKRSINKCYQHGKGVYFTDSLDYCWFYGGEKNNRCNKNRIPKIYETFTLIVNSIYYNKKGLRRVNDYKYTPKKNEINFALANSDL